jgi:diguanylate cyclase (GGDEF)-like protein
MLIWQNKQIWFLLMIFLLSVLIGCFAAYAIQLGGIRAVLMLITIVTIAFGGLLGGSIIALLITLLCLFIFGTFSLIQAWDETILSANQFFQLELLPIIVWFLVSISIATISGQILTRFRNILKENQHLHERYDELVQIDVDSSFDNDTRFALIMEEEFKRVKRYGGDLTLLIIEFQYYGQFEQLYGERETRQTIKKIANQIRSNIRISDRKFRITPNHFAILLTETPLEHGMIVIKKINDSIHNILLSDEKRQVTLTFKYGLAGIDQQIDSWTEFVDHAKNDISTFSIH